MGRQETPLEMTARHVREGLERLAGQEALVLRLEESDPGELLPVARALLVEIQKFQKTADEHLARLLAKLEDAEPD